MDANTSLLWRGEVAYAPCGGDSLFRDLNIDQIIAAAAEGLEEFNLGQFYNERPLNREDAEFRADVARDLWEEGTLETIGSFLAGLSQVKRYLNTADAVFEAPAKGKWKLDAAAEYTQAVAALCGFDDKGINSAGLKRFLSWLREYAETEDFIDLRDASYALKNEADRISYTLKLDIGNNCVYFGDDEGSGDICAGLTRMFDRYDLRYINRDITAFADIHMNVLEKKILSVIQAEHPDLLDRITNFYRRFGEIMHAKILAFERETLFFISYIRFAKRLEGKGFPFSFPEFTERGLRITGGYDASLALVSGDCGRVVFNDFKILEGEKSFLLTGPNQGGKTTFSRMFGQILHLSSLGLPVPCEGAKICWTNGLRTHFNKEETPGGDMGRLKEELTRLSRILKTAPENSVVILNELFSSTTTYDALEMGKRVMGLFGEKGCVCLYVTHLYELASVAGAVSLTAEVNGDCTPTYRVSRNLANGGAFANRLLTKRRLRAADIKERTHAAFTVV